MASGWQGDTASLAGGVASDGGVVAASGLRSAISAEPLFVGAESRALDYDGTAVRSSRRLHKDDMWKPAVGVLVGMMGLLLVLLACFICRRWRRRLQLMKKTVKDFSSAGVVDVEAPTIQQAGGTTNTSRTSSGANPPPPAPIILPPHPPTEKLVTRHVLNVVPPSPHSSASSQSRPKMERSKASALLSTPTSQNPPKGLAPTPPMQTKTKQNRADARGAGLPTPIKTIKTKQNRVEEGTASPMTAMSTEAPSSITGIPPTRWEHEKVHVVVQAGHRRSGASVAAADKASGSAGEGGELPCTTKLQRKSSSFERARGAIIGYDLDIPHGTLDSASGSVAIDGLKSGASTAAPSNSTRNPLSTGHSPNRNISSDSACGSFVVRDGPRTTRRNTAAAGDGRMREASAPSKRPLSGAGGGGGGGGGRRTLADAGVFESFASLGRGDYTFDSNNSANPSSAARGNASSALAAAPGYNTSTIVPAGKTRHLPISPIDGLFSGGYASTRRRAHTIEGDSVVPEEAGSGELRATLRHRRSKTDFPSPRGGGIDFRWDSAAGSAFRESGADNFCPGCLGTGVKFDSAAGSIFPPSCTGTPGRLSRRASSSRFDGGSSPMVVYGEDVDGAVVVGNVGSGVRCHCVRDPAGRDFSEERGILQGLGGRQRSFSVSAVPYEGSLSHLFGKE